MKRQINGFPLDAVGESHYQDALERICGGHNRDGHYFEVEAVLRREPANPHDPNAVAVWIEEHIVGYLPRDQAARVSGQMAEDGIDEVACEAQVVGGWRTNQYDEGHFGVKLGVPRRGWIDFGLGKTDPASKPENSTKPVMTTIPVAAASGPLSGQFVLLWGAPKDGDLARELAGLGAQIMAGIGKSTTMVVLVNDELTPGMMSSSTYRKAQERISEGANLEIISLTVLRSRLSASSSTSEGTR